MKEYAENRRRLGGFTLVEVVVTIGVLAVLSFIVAQVFATVGDTVSNGKRLSTLNRRAAQFEQVMRRDFERMAREDGFLVIRNEFAQTAWNRAVPSDPDPVVNEDKIALFPGDPEPRRRRIDEIMFFVKAPLGESFTSVREPLVPGVVATAREARIYYGHGQRYPRDAGDPRSSRPMLDESNIPVAGAGGNARLGEQAGASLDENPNEFASNWALLRHATLLSPTADGAGPVPDRVLHLVVRDGGGTLDAQALARVQDNSRQVALQPAAQSIFRSIGALRPDLPAEFQVGVEFAGIRPNSSFRSPRGPTPRVYAPAGNDGFFGNVQAERLAAPLFTSGLVDIATTSLSEIRSVIESPYLRSGGAAALAGPFGPDRIARPAPSGGDHIEIRTATDGGVETMSRWATSWDAAGPTAPTRGTPAGVPPSAANFEGPVSLTRADQIQQQWMLNAMPTEPFRPDTGSAERTGQRIRYVDEPQNLYVGDIVNDEERLLDAIEQADQAMLRSSVFMRHCSEFIVEFSMGMVDDNPDSPTYGQLIWHGLRRWVDADNDGQYDSATERLLAYDDLERININGENTNQVRPGALRAPRELLNPHSVVLDGVGTLSARLNDRSKMFPAVTVDDMGEPLYSDKDVPDNGYTAIGDDAESVPQIEWVFGYEDVPGAGTFRSVTGELRPRADPQPWPWPRLIRVTVRLSDEDDPGIETTYQSVFRVPSLPGS